MKHERYEAKSSLRSLVLQPEEFRAFCEAIAREVKAVNQTENIEIRTEVGHRSITATSFDELASDISLSPVLHSCSITTDWGQPVYVDFRAWESVARLEVTGNNEVLVEGVHATLSRYLVAHSPLYLRILNQPVFAGVSGGVFISWVVGAILRLRDMSATLMATGSLFITSLAVTLWLYTTGVLPTVSLYIRPTPRRFITGALILQVLTGLSAIATILNLFLR